MLWKGLEEKLQQFAVVLVLFHSVTFLTKCTQLVADILQSLLLGQQSIERGAKNVAFFLITEDAHFVPLEIVVDERLIKPYNTIINMLSQETAWLLAEKYHGEKSPAFFTDISRLEAGEPLAYVIGHIPFLNTTISLTSRPLIPRPETEYWTAKVIADIEQLTATKNPLVLDLCAGSGAIGVAIAKAVPQSLVHFIELESSHLPTIALNCRQNGVVPERVHILTGNLFQTKEALPRFDVIVTNPPYIDPILDRTEDSVKGFEPEVALYGGKDGLELISKIILTAPNFLVPGGSLYIEHEPEQSKVIQELAHNTFIVTTHQDQYNLERYTKLVLQY